MTGTRLVADVGGTNTRIGLAEHGELLTNTVRGYRNDEYGDFPSVVESYLADLGPGPFKEMAVAVAGPVSGKTARLTNRNWRFDVAGLSARFGGVPVFLLNDLNALGHASQILTPDSLEVLYHAGSSVEVFCQSLVIGIGTGFNISPVVRSNGKVTCLNAEYGHVSLPHDIAESLSRRFGAATAGFRTVEDVFSGRGYAEISKLFSDHDVETSGQNELETATPDDGFRDYYANLVARLTRNLMLAFLPTSGIFFAGGVARNLLTTPSRASFVEEFRKPFDLDQKLAASVYCILDDSAALKGCAAMEFDG